MAWQAKWTMLASGSCCRTTLSGIEVLPLPLLHHHDTTMWSSEQRNILSSWKASNFGQMNKRPQDLLFSGWLWRGRQCCQTDHGPTRHKSDRVRGASSQGSLDSYRRAQHTPIPRCRGSHQRSWGGSSARTLRTGWEVGR